MIKNYDDRDFKDISTAVEAHLNGNDYGIGEIEAIRAEVGNISTCIGNLVEVFVEKGIFTEEEVEDVILKGLFE